MMNILLIDNHKWYWNKFIRYKRS